MCEHHQLIGQCWFDYVKTIRQWVEGLGFTFVRHEIPNLYQCPWKHIIEHHTKLSFFIMSASKKVDPHRIQKVGYKCNVTPWGLKDGKYPT
jgi:hypothetical protein